MIYGEQTAQSLQTHAFSGQQLFQYPAYVRHLCWVKQAAARANWQCGVITEGECARIAQACDTLSTQIDPSTFPVDVFQGGGSIAVHSNVGEALTCLTNLPASVINASQSTADVCATALRLALLEVGQLACDSQMANAQQLESKAQLHASTRTLARTCLRDACSTTWGDSFGAYAAVTKRRGEELQASLWQLQRINLGGTVIGSGQGAPPGFRALAVAHLAERTGLTLISRDNLFDAAQNSDDLAAVSHTLALLAEVWIKVAQDIRLLSSGPQAGLGELVVPPLLQGSTFFSGKSNPTLVETLLQCCFDILGKHRTVQACLEHAELNLNVFDGMAGICLYDALRRLANCLTHFHDHCLVGLTPDVARCAHWSDLAQPAPR